MKFISPPGFILPAALFLLVVSSCNQQYDLKFRPAVGSRYRLEMHSTSDISRKLPLKESKIKSTTDMSLVYTIDDEGRNDSADKFIRLRFENIRTRQQADSMLLDMDSGKPDSTDPVSRMLNALSGSDFIVVVAGNGTIKEIRGKDALLSKMIETTRPGDTLMRSQIMANMKTFMTDEIIKNMLDQSFGIFPDGKISVGDEWHKNHEIVKPMPMNIDNKYTLTAIDGDNASLKVEGVITPGKQEGSVMGFVVKTELKGTQTGTISLNIKTGIAVSTEIKQDINGRMINMGRSAPLTIVSTVTYKTTKL